jgi:purine nucleosidase
MGGLDMRKLIIDTDTGSDDAVALIMALKSANVKVEAITTVCGNVPLELATKNALMTIEVANGQEPPLYIGAAKPLMRDLVTAVNVHGEDGMGDCNLINPTLLPETKHAVDAILDIIENNPGEIEINHRSCYQYCPCYFKSTGNYEKGKTYVHYGYCWIWPWKHYTCSRI